MRPRVRWLVATVAAAASLACGAAAAAAEDDAPVPHIIRDPHYGDSLFYFFQDRYFSSLTKLMVSQHFGRVSHHEDEAQILRGGLMLSYGMHRQAGEIFAQLIEQGAEPRVRDRAWFYLAKIRYQRGLIDEAYAAVGKIENHLPPELDEERDLLTANLLLARGDYAAAAQVLGTLTDKPERRGGDVSGARRYARFNLGIALIRNGDVERGSVYLDELGRAPAENEEFRSLRDKANVALGFAALKDEHPEQARAALQRVRLSGLHSNKALLGFGWAAAALKKPKEALVPWQTLAQRDPSDSAVLEARLAVPYALAEVQAYGQSLDGYNDAIAAYDNENASLDESITAIRAGHLVDSLVELNPGEEMGWFWRLRALPEGPGLPHPAHLSQVLAEHQFQEAFKNYRDLLFLAKNLQDWQDNLGVYADMLANRRDAYAQRLPQVLAQARGIGIDALAQRRDQLAAELAGAENDADGVAFADAKERDLLARIARVRSALQTAGDEPGMASARERARLAAGALTWQLSQAFPARVWEAQKSFKGIDAGLDEARMRDAAIVAAQRDEPARFEQFAARIVELQAQLQRLIPKVAGLSQEQQAALQELAVAALSRQKDRLAGYTEQARFAVAQLYDRAKQDSDRAIKP